MSQRTVEQIIGKLVTDEGFRRRWGTDAHLAIEEIGVHEGDLNPCERRALLTLDVGRLDRLADLIDPCLAKVDLSGGIP